MYSQDFLFYHKEKHLRTQLIISVSFENSRGENAKRFRTPVQMLRSHDVTARAATPSRCSLSLLEIVREDVAAQVMTSRADLTCLLADPSVVWLLALSYSGPQQQPSTLPLKLFM
ncbi:hypothetical protein E2C01_038128 [Portunus trituberculatus]|uniref:Uncharacterized protein n=1 Tax=Portunus trituberculatus TaxID=210409 RepID=A0A5B7FFZ6_PORTR|nr:hypothetical protein [Portunus trituberculatus]